MWGAAIILTGLLITSLIGNAALYFRMQIARRKLKIELEKPEPEPRVIIETRVVEKPVPVAVNHVESRGLGGRNLSTGSSGGFMP